VILPGGATFLIPTMVLDFLVSILTVILVMILGGWVGLVGRFVLRVASFGGVHAAPIDVPPHEFNWFYCRRSENWLIEVESTVAAGIGIVLCFIYLALFLHFF